MDKTVLKLKVLAKAESTLFSLRFRRYVSKIVFWALAFVFVIVFVSMLNVAAYAWLAPEYGNVAAALIVAGVNLFLAVMLILIAMKFTPKSDEKLVAEIRELALADLSDDVDEAKAMVAKVKNDVNAVKQFIGTKGALVGSKIDVGGISTLVGYLIKFIKRR